MAGDAEELPPLVQDLIARYDPALSQPQFDKMSRGQQDAVRDMNKSLERIAKSAGVRQARLLAEELRKQSEIIRKSYQQRERLALNAGKREGEIVKATSREVVVARKQANTQELEVQRKGTAALVTNQRKGMAKWEETIKRSYFRMRGAYQRAQQDQQQAQDRSNQQQQQSQQQANQRSRQQQDRAWKVWFALFEDYLKRKRAEERAAQYKDLADQKAADRRKWQEQKSADSERLAAQKAMYRQQVIAQQTAATKSINAHKAMWSILRSLTETGGRFMSSITQSFLRSMGTGITRGLGRITGTYRREGEQQQAALRSNFAQQEQITRRAMVRQQGIVQGFQTRNSAVAQGGKGGGPIGAIMSVRNMLLGAGAFISARAIFGPIMDYQQTKIAFEGILQSGTAAEAMLTQLQNFAKVTPFTFAGIADSAKQLLAVGYAADDVIPMMTTLGNTAAGLGLGEDAISGVIRALGQMKGKGKASAEELQQISEQLPGFSAIEAIASSMGITVAEAFDQMKAGAIPADAAIEAILAGMERMPGAAGAMERQSRSLNGRLSTLKDTIQILTIRAMDPFIGTISDGIGLFTTLLDNLFNAGGVFKLARSAIMGLAIALGSMLAYQGVVLMLDGIRLALVGMTRAPVLVLFTGLVVAMTMLYRHVPGVAEAFHSLWDALSGIASGALETVRETFVELGENLLPNIAVMLRWIAKGEWVNALESLGGILREAMTGLWEGLLAVGDFLRPFAGLLVSAFEYAFWSVQLWLNTGGAGRLWDALKGAVSSVFGRMADFDWTMLVRPALIAIAGAIAFAIGGIPLLLGTALIALSPRLQGGILEMLAGIGAAISGNLPKILFNALHDAAEFLSGPVLATIFGPVGVRVIAGIAGAVVGAAYAIATGLIDGLKRSLPSVIDAVQGLMSDVIGAASEALGDFPIIGRLLAEVFFPLEVALQGILPTLGLFVDIVRVIPTPVIAASAAIFGLVKAWTALSLTARSQSVLSGFTGMLDTIALRTMYAGDAIGRLGTRMTNATAPAIMNGAASRVQIAMGTIGTAAQGAGAAVSAIGAAMPAIGMAAAIGIPVVLGLMQRAKQKQQQWRDEINRTAVSMLDLETTARDVLTQIIRDSGAAAAALRDAGVTIEQLFTSITDSTGSLGDTYADLMGMSDVFARTGVDMREFGQAVLEGDQATRDFFTTLRQDQSTTALKEDVLDLQYAYSNLPDELRDAADAMAENSRQMLIQAAAAGELTAGEAELLGVILAMEHPEARLIDMQQDVTDRMTGAKEAAERQAEAYQNMRDRIDEVANSTSLFNDVLDRLTGNALPLTRVRENIEDAVAAFRELMNDPEASPSEQSRAFTDYAESIRSTAEDLLNLNRPLSEVLAAYQLQRREIIDQRIALGDSRTAAREYAEEVLGLPPVAEMRAEFEDREATNKIARIKGRMETLASMRPTPRVRMDLERYHLQKVALDAELQGLSDREITIRVQMVAAFDSAFENAIQQFLDNPDPQVQALGRDMRQRWAANLPQLASGGIVTKPTVAMIGEAGPEAVIPLSDGMGKIPLSVMFDTSAIAGQIAAVAALLAPMGERISGATMPGLRSWAGEVGALLDAMASDFKDWGQAMVVTATLIGTSIASAMSAALREGRGEVTRIVRGYGRNLATALNPLLEAIGEQPVTMEFAKGGIAEAYQGAQVHVFNEGRRGRGSSHGEAYIPFDPANKPRSQALAAETVRRLGGDVQWYARGGLSPDAIRRGQSFARAQDGKPYVWGGVGPNGYDCSGLASAIVNAVRGEDPYRRLFTSGSLVAGASAGLLPGLGQVSVGARSGSPGHVSSTIAGLNAESTGDHVRIGAAARSAADFPSRWHLGSGVFIGPNGTTYPLPTVPEVGRGDLGRLGSGWMRYVRRKARRFVDENTYTGTAFGGPESGVPTGMQVGDGSPQILAAIRRAMGIVGVPSSWLGPLLTLIGRESSFNPRAYNGILGASGLMQTIPGTFAAHALPGYGGIFDPVANVIAGLRYILSRYGSIFNVGQAVSANPTSGYSYGGVVDRDGMYRLAEGNRREVVLPLENRGRLNELLRRTGLADTIAMAASADPVTFDSIRSDSATSPTSPSMAPVVGELNVYSNAMDPEIVANLAAAKVNRVAARVRG